MNFVRIGFTPNAVCVFTYDETLTLFKCSATHYDANCKAASQEGGFIYLMKNRVDFRGDSVEHELSGKQIDTMLKILEMPPEGCLPVASSLMMYLGRVMTQLSVVQRLEALQ